ncbi:MAG: 4Fe-4S ferredoxin [Syntrophobacteria bacterium]
MQEFEGCPGSRMFEFKDKGAEDTEEATGKIESQLRQWPIQLHLISPLAPYYQGADVLLAADCVAFALGDFHRQFLQGKSIAIACPKLDEGQDIYVEKIKGWFEEAKINTLTVLIMQVPCCMGLISLAQQASQASQRKVPIKQVVVGVEGEILQEEWVQS